MEEKTMPETKLKSKYPMTMEGLAQTNVTRKFLVKCRLWLQLKSKITWKPGEFASVFRFSELMPLNPCAFKFEVENSQRKLETFIEKTLKEKKYTTTSTIEDYFWNGKQVFGEGDYSDIPENWDTLVTTETTTTLNLTGKWKEWRNENAQD